MDKWYSDEVIEDTKLSSIRKRFFNFGRSLLLFILAGIVMVIGIRWLSLRNGEVTELSVLVAVTALPTQSEPPTQPSSADISPSATLVEKSETESQFDETCISAELTTVTEIRILQQSLFDLVNQERVANGLSTVEWDDSAELAGCVHAVDMADNNFFSHWNQQGLGPDHRYTLIDGRHTVAENLHTFSYTFDDGTGAPIDDWETVIVNAHNGLMNSPGHRATILDPVHTHVGFGMAYNVALGQFTLAQEFTNQYVSLSQSLPVQAVVGDNIGIQGIVQGDNIDNILLDIVWEPFPEPMSQAQLARTSTYRSAAENTDATRRIDSVFSETVTLDYNGRPGVYHVRIFADIDGQQALILDHSIWVS